MIVVAHTCGDSVNVEDLDTLSPDMLGLNQRYFRV